MSQLRIVSARGRAESEGKTIRISDLLRTCPDLEFTGLKDILIPAIDLTGKRHDLRFNKPTRNGTTTYIAKKAYPDSLPQPVTGKGGDRYLTILSDEVKEI